MGAIRMEETERRIPLLARFRVGRAADAALVLTHASVSRDHAMITWNGTGWEVRDLGSQNGTFVRGARLPTGGRAEFEATDVVAFASGAKACLVDATPPQPLARSAQGDWLEGIDGTLELLGEQSDGEADVSVWCDTSGTWRLQDAAGERSVSDGEAVDLGGARWTLVLPDAVSLRITERGSGAQPGAPPLALGAATFDCQERVLRRDGATVALSPTEARLLQYLARRAGAVVTHRELLSEVWGYAHGVESRTVYVTIGRLRQKIERDPTAPEHLIAVAGAGYLFRAVAA